MIVLETFPAAAHGEAYPLLNYHILADSFGNEATLTDMLIEMFGDDRLTCDKDAVGGTSLAQQRVRLEADPEGQRRLLISWDGGLDDTASGAIEAVLGMAAALDHPYWVYVQAHRQYGSGNGAAGLSAWLANQEVIKQGIGAERFVETYQALFDAAISDPEDPGYADDQADVAAGYPPRSLRIDDIHPNLAGQQVRLMQVKQKLIALGWFPPKSGRIEV